MKILCITNKSKTLYNLAKIILGDSIISDITARNNEISAKFKDEVISVKFMSSEQSCMQFTGLRPDILIFQGGVPRCLMEFANSIRITGGLILDL